MGKVGEIGANDGGAGFDLEVHDLRVGMAEPHGFFDLRVNEGIDDVRGAFEFGDDLLIDADDGGGDAFGNAVEMIGAANAGDGFGDAGVFCQDAGENVYLAAASDGEEEVCLVDTGAMEAGHGAAVASDGHDVQ